MIEIQSVSRGEVSITRQVYRNTKLYQINSDIEVSMSTLSRPDEFLCVEFSCSQFTGLVEFVSGVDISYFEIFDTRKYTEDDIEIIVSTSTVDYETLKKYQIVFTREYLSNINTSKYETTIRKLIKTFTGV